MEEHLDGWGVLFPHGPHPGFDTKVEIVTTKIAKDVFRVLPLHQSAMFSFWLQMRESDPLLVLIMNVIL